MNSQCFVSVVLTTALVESMFYILSVAIDFPEKICFGLQILSRNYLISRITLTERSWVSNSNLNSNTMLLDLVCWNVIYLMLHIELNTSFCCSGNHPIPR